MSDSVGLLDIGDLEETVTIRGKAVRVNGLSAEAIVSLMQRFPQVRQMMGGRQAELSPEQVMGLAGGAVAAIIAAGTGQLNNKEVEAVASKLTVGEQTEIIAKMFELSFPFGVEHFISSISRLSESVAGASGDTGWAQDTKSPKQSKG